MTGSNIHEVGDRVSLTPGCSGFTPEGITTIISPLSHVLATIYMIVWDEKDRKHCCVCLDQSGESFLFPESSLIFEERCSIEQLLTHAGKAVRAAGLKKQKELLCQRSVLK